MGFFGLGKPKWRHADPSVRRGALERLNSADEHIAVRMALEDADEGIRAAAASKVTGETNLKRLAGSDDAKVATIARSRLAGVAQRLVKEGKLADIRGLLGAIKEHSALAELACTANDPAVRVAALDHLLGLDEPSPTALATVAIQDASGDLAARALERISKRSALKDIARKAKADRTRTAAQARIDALGTEERQPSLEQRRRARREAVEAVLPRFGRVVVASDLSIAQDEYDLATSTLEGILAESDDLDDDDTVALAKQRRGQAAQALDALRDQVRAKAQAESEAIALRESFITRVGDGTEVGERDAIESSWSLLPSVPTEVADRLESHFADAIATRFKVTAGTGYRVLDEGEAHELAAVANEAEKLVPQADSRESKQAEFRFQDLHKRWTALTHGCDPQLADRVRFTRAWDDFKAKRREARDARKQESEERLKRLGELVADAERFAADPVAEAEQEARYEALKNLRFAWRGVGHVRGGEAMRARFEAALDLAFEPLNQLREAEDWERFANVAKAEALTTEIKALAEVSDLPAVSRGVREAHKQWKTIGPLPRDRQQALWIDFKNACDTQFDRCKVHYAELDAKRAVSKETKERILAEAQELSGKSSAGLAGSPADRAIKEAAANRLKELQGEWKLAGPAPRDDEERLWQAFRTACDGFFQSFHAVRDQEFQQNLLRKEAILVEMEKLVASVNAQPDAPGAEREKWLRHIRDLQGRWKDVGFVPRERHEEFNRRYRAAADVVYNAGRADVGESDAEQTENLAAKLDLCARLEALGESDDARSDADQLRLRWDATGPVPNAERKAVDERWKTAWSAVMSSGERR